MDDYYDVLGVKKDATQEEIDAAYRTLARKWHPDMHPEDQKQSATEQFKKIAEAYEVLGNVERRAQYDNRGSFNGPFFGSFNVPPSAAQSDFVNDVFSNFFGQNKATVRGTRIRLQVSLKEAFVGCRKTIELQQQMPCAACNASGASKWAQCGVCGGSGMRALHQAAFLIRTTCTACNGQGRMPVERCSKCSGQGQIRGEIEKVEVEVPRGIEDGAQIRVPDKGLNKTDLYVVINVVPDEKYGREGRHLFVDLPISYSQLVLGGSASVDMLDGSKAEVKIRPGTQGGVRLRVKGQGMPTMQSPDIRGDLFVTLFVKIPKKVSEEQRELLEKLRDLE